MKKRIIAMLVSAAVAVSLLASAALAEEASSEEAVSEEAVSEEATSEEAASEAGADGYEMAYVLSVRDEFLGMLEKDVAKAAEDAGVNMEMLYAGSDSQRMIDCIKAADTMNKDAVIINLNAAEDAQACIEAAGDMKVVFINRVPADYEVLSENAAAVASDEHTSGAYQGEFLAKYFQDKGQTEVNYLLLRGTDGLVHTTLRCESALKAMEDAGLTLNEVAVIDADYDRNTAKNALAELLPDLEYDCIISNNDAMAIGAIMALQEAGMDPKAVPIVGIDATADGVEELKNGNLAMTVYQSSEGQAAGAVRAAINMLEGKELTEGTDNEISADNPYVVYVPFLPVTPENVDTFRE